MTAGLPVSWISSLLILIQQARLLLTRSTAKSKKETVIVQPQVICADYLRCGAVLSADEAASRFSCCWCASCPPSESAPYSFFLTSFPLQVFSVIAAAVNKKGQRDSIQTKKTSDGRKRLEPLITRWWMWIFAKCGEHEAFFFFFQPKLDTKDTKERITYTHTHTHAHTRRPWVWWCLAPETERSGVQDGDLFSCWQSNHENRALVAPTPLLCPPPLATAVFFSFQRK